MARTRARDERHGVGRTTGAGARGARQLVFFQGDFARAQELLHESTLLAREARVPAIAGLALGLHTMAAMESGDLAGAARLAAESAAAAREATEPWLQIFSLSFFAYEALFAGDIDRAGRLHEEILALSRSQGDLWVVGIVLFDLAMLRVVQQRPGEARTLGVEAIALGRRFRDRRAIGWSLGVLAGADAAQGRPERAARLLGAMQGLLESIGAPMQPSYNALIGDRLFSALLQELGEDGYQQALAAGRALSMSHAIDYAMEEQVGVPFTA